jgi:ABC-type nitrate/sulfonate/bicarbonate transport system substrate-binding protein
VFLMIGALWATGFPPQTANSANGTPEVIQLTIGDTSPIGTPTSFVPSLAMREIPNLYRRVGLKVNSIAIPLGQAVQLVQAGNPPVAQGTGPSYVVFGRMHGATSVRIFAGEMQKPPWELVVRKGITQLNEIKTLGVSSVGATSSQNCQTILRSAHMRANRDYDLVLLGNASARIAAVQAGKVDGSCEPLPYPEYYHDKYGMAVLAKTSDYLPYYATGGWIYNAQWAQDPIHRAALVRLTEAILLAHRWTMDPSNKSRVEAMAARAFKVPDRYAELYYAELVGRQLLTPDGYIPKQAAESNAQDYANMGLVGPAPPFSRYYDWSILQEAARTLGFSIRQPEY